MAPPKHPPKPPEKHYITPLGAKQLQEELRLLRAERPKVVEVVSWAAGNGDRSENGDYIYGKKRLREIDKRTGFIQRQLSSATLVDPSQQQGLAKVFFGATVTYEDPKGKEHSYTIVGCEEASLETGTISWKSPLARALMKKEEGDIVSVQTPSGVEKIEIIEIQYIIDRT